MSSPLTAAFLAAWNRSGRDGVTLVKVELTDPSALTLYLSTAEVHTPGAPRQVWEAALADVDGIHAPGEPMTPSVALCSAGFVVLDRQLPHQSGSAKARSAFSTHRWVGAAVTIYFWERSMTTGPEQMFKGEVQNYVDEARGVRVNLLQSLAFNRDLGTSIVSRDRYPRAPEASMGKVIPGPVYGYQRGVETRAPITSKYGDVQHWFDRITGGKRLSPGVIVDQGGLAARVTFAAHPCKFFGDTPAATGYLEGCMPYIEIDGRKCMVDPAVGDIYNDSTDGTGFNIGNVPSGGADPFAICYLPLIPVQIENVAANNAEGMRALLDPLNDTSYARLDYDAGLYQLRARLPSIAPPGDIVRFDAEIIYRSVGSCANVWFQLLNTATGLQTTLTGLTGSATPLAEGFGSAAGWGSGGGWPVNPWQFGDCVLAVFFNAASAGVKLDIFAVGLSVRFRPKRDPTGIATQQLVFPEVPPDRKTRIPKEGAIPPYVTFTPTLSVPSGAFFANIAGYVDDGGGTYTGVAAAVIERAPDIMHHLLAVYGGLAAGDFELGATAFGSLVYARDFLKTWNQADMVHAFSIAEKTDVIRTLEMLAEDALCWPYRSRFDSKWHVIPWKVGSAVDFNRTLTKYDLRGAAPEIEMVPETRILAGVRVPYSFDQSSGRHLHESSIGTARSIAGHRWRNLRDEQLSVIAAAPGQNNKLDFQIVGGATYAATLTTGDYASGEAARADLLAAMQAAHADDWVVCYCPEIVAGKNDKLTIQQNEDGANKVATCAASAYATMEAEAAAWTTALNAVSSNFTVTYSRATRKFTIARTVNTFKVQMGLGVPADVNGTVALGYARTSTAYGASFAADFEREEQFFAVGNTTRDFNLLSQTGANGLDAGLKNCAALFGFDSSRDSTTPATGATGSFVGVCPKGRLEQVLAAAQAKYRGKREVSLGGRTIFDSPTAREVRNRIVDFWTVPRALIRFESDLIPDMERGKVFAFDASVNDLKAYGVAGSDGSWAGKKFQCVEVVQHCGGDSYATEIVAVEIGA